MCVCVCVCVCMYGCICVCLCVCVCVCVCVCAYVELCREAPHTRRFHTHSRSPFARSDSCPIPDKQASSRDNLYKGRTRNVYVLVRTRCPFGTLVTARVRSTMGGYIFSLSVSSYLGWGYLGIRITSRSGEGTPGKVRMEVPRDGGPPAQVRLEYPLPQPPLDR